MSGSIGTIAMYPTICRRPYFFVAWLREIAAALNWSAGERKGILLPMDVTDLIRSRHEPISQYAKLRSFLISSGLAVAASIAGTLERTGEASQSKADVSRRSKLLTDPVSLVSLLQATDSTHSFSRGNTLPIASRPFRMAHCPASTRPSGVTANNRCFPGAPWI
jgi:hypothetical protein